jgi:hypothetical protein
MFNHKIIFTVSVLASAIALSACQPKQTEKKEESVQVQQEQQVPKLEGTVEKISLNLPKCDDQNCPELTIDRLSSNQAFIDNVIDQQIIEILKQTLSADDDEMPKNTTKDQIASEINQENIETAKQKLEKQVSPFVQNFLDLDKEIKTLSPNHKISLLIKPKILNSQGPLVTVVLNSSNYLGGAHGSSAQQYFNFDLDTQKQVPLKEIVEKNKLPELKAKAYDAFKAWIIESELSTDVKEYEQVWKFKLADHYYLGTKGLILQYGEYEIGPYVVGLPRLTIPYDQLQGILKEKYLPKVEQSDQVASEASSTKK